MAWIYLAESVDSASPYPPGSGQSPTVKTIGSLNLFCYQGWPSLICHAHPSGTISGLCEVECYQDIPMSSMGGSPARISVLRELERAWKASEVGWFSRYLGLLGKLNPRSSFWKTFQPLGPAEANEWGKNWPNLGMIVDGILYPLKKSERPTKESDGFVWPTPTQRDWKSSASNLHGKNSRPPNEVVKFWSTPRASDGAKGGPGMKFGSGSTAPLPAQVGGTLSPLWVEWLMGYPIGWTALEDWVMPWLRSKRGKHLDTLAD